jgi:hypothetical protein
MKGLFATHKARNTKNSTGLGAFSKVSDIKNKGPSCQTKQNRRLVCWKSFILRISNFSQTKAPVE